MREKNRRAGLNLPYDHILIEGLRCFAYVGVPEAERRHRQRLLLDIALETSLAKAGRTDDVRATVDYAHAAMLAKRIAEERPYRLVEAIAERAAAALLKAFSSVESVTIRVRKLSVPQAESVGVEITRRR